MTLPILIKIRYDELEDLYACLAYEFFVAKKYSAFLVLDPCDFRDFFHCTRFAFDRIFKNYSACEIDEVRNQFKRTADIFFEICNEAHIPITKILLEILVKKCLFSLAVFEIQK